MNEEKKENLGYIPLLASWVLEEAGVHRNRSTYGQNGNSERFDMMQCSVACCIFPRRVCCHMNWEAPGNSRAAWRPRLPLVVTLESSVNDGRILSNCLLKYGHGIKGSASFVGKHVSPGTYQQRDFPMTYTHDKRVRPGSGAYPAGLTSTRYGA